MATLNPTGCFKVGPPGAPRGVVCLVSLGILCLALTGCSARPPRVATVLVGGSVVQEAGGEVEVVRADAPAPARPGFELQAGDVIRTGPRGQALLSLEGGRVEVIVLENTEVEVSSIFVKVGTVITRVLRRVKDKFEVESDYAVAGAESTEFLIAIEPEGDYRCAVIEGRVQVRSQSGQWSPVTLARGEEVTGRPGTKAERRELDRNDYHALVRRINAITSAIRPSSATLVAPDVIGLPEDEARRTLVDFGVRVGDVGRTITRRARIGTVIDQSPSPGSRLRAGGSIDLVVEAEPTIVPELSGLPLVEAERRLAAASLRMGEVRREITGTRRPGEVLRQQPEPNREEPAGSEVALWVEAPSVLVPTFTRLDREQAEALLRQTGLRAQAETRLVEGVADGVVLEQRPQAGARVQPGTTVALIIAERGVRVPDLVGGSRRVLERSLAGRDLVAGQVSSRPERRPPGTIVEQSPAPGTLVRPGTPVHVTVADRCTVPDVGQWRRDAALEAISRAMLSGRIGGGGDYTFYSRESSNQVRVTAQDPPPGTRVECGSTVTIYLGAVD